MEQGVVMPAFGKSQVSCCMHWHGRLLQQRPVADVVEDLPMQACWGLQAAFPVHQPPSCKRSSSGGTFVLQS